MTPSTDRIHQFLARGVRDRAYPGTVWAIGATTGTQVAGAVGLGGVRRG